MMFEKAVPTILFTSALTQNRLNFLFPYSKKKIVGCILSWMNKNILSPQITQVRELRWSSILTYSVKKRIFQRRKEWSTKIKTSRSWERTKVCPSTCKLFCFHPSWYFSALVLLVECKMLTILFALSPTICSCLFSNFNILNHINIYYLKLRWFIRIIMFNRSSHCTLSWRTIENLRLFWYKIY